MYKKLVALLFIMTSIVGCSSSSAAPEAQEDYGQLLQFQPLEVPQDLNKVANNFVINDFNKGFANTDAGALMNMQNAAELYNFVSANKVSTAAAGKSAATNMQDYIKKYTADAGVTGVSAYAIDYNSPGVDPQHTPSDMNRTISGLVLAPTMQAGSKPKGIVLFYHATAAGKNSVPSCLALAATKNRDTGEYTGLPAYCTAGGGVPDGATSDKYYNMLVSLYVDRGFIVVAPDYVGQGIDIDVVHPYVAFPDPNALSGLNMLFASKELLIQHGVLSSTDTLPLFITGFSEGGAYALRASQLAQTTQQLKLQDNHIALAITAAEEGAYSLEKQLDFEFADLKDGVFNGDFAQQNMMSGHDVIVGVAAQNNWHIVSSPYSALGKPTLTGYVLDAVLEYDFRNLDSAYSTVINDGFWENIAVVEPQVHSKMDDISCLKDVKAGGDISECIIKEHLTLSELFHKVGLSSSEIALALTKDAFQFALYDRKSDLHVKLYPTADTDVDNQAEAINIIADDSKLGRAFGVGNGIGAFVNEAVTKQPVFFDILAKGTTYKWISHSPINFINLQYDSVVARANYDDAYNYMLTSSPGMIASTLIPNFQLTNVIDQYKPLLKSAVSHFWAPIDAIAETIVPNVDSAVMAQPNDHGSPITFNLSNVIASCVFTNWLASNGSANQALCPN